MRLGARSIVTLLLGSALLSPALAAGATVDPALAAAVASRKCAPAATCRLTAATTAAGPKPAHMLRSATLKSR